MAVKTMAELMPLLATKEKLHAEADAELHEVEGDGSSDEEEEQVEVEAEEGSGEEEVLGVSEEEIVESVLTALDDGEEVVTREPGVAEPDQGVSNAQPFHAVEPTEVLSKGKPFNQMKELKQQMAFMAKDLEIMKGELQFLGSRSMRQAELLQDLRRELNKKGDSALDRSVRRVKEQLEDHLRGQR